MSSVYIGTLNTWRSCLLILYMEMSFGDYFNQPVTINCNHNILKVTYTELGQEVQGVYNTYLHCFGLDSN